MNESFDSVFQAAMALPESDRVQLVDAIISTLAPEDAAPLHDSWLAEIERRSREFDEGKTLPIPWEVVKERARQCSDGNG